MPTIYELKPAFQSLPRSLTRALASSRITPRQATLAAMFPSFAPGAAVMRGSQPIFFFQERLLTKLSVRYKMAMLYGYWLIFVGFISAQCKTEWMG